MKTRSSLRAQRIRADRAIGRVREVAAAHVQPAELEALTSGAATDARRLAIGAEALVLISTGVGLVSSGLGLLIKNHNLDIRLAVTLICLAGGLAGIWWEVPCGVPRWSP